MKKKYGSIGRFMLLGAAALLLSECEAANQQFLSATEAEVGPYPNRYREIAAEYLRKTLFDPYTVRDAQISRPKMGRLFVEGSLGRYEPGWLLCFRANAKNRMGAYTGVSDTALVIRDERVLASLSDPSHSHYLVKRTCDAEPYESFPEIEQGARSSAR